MLISESVKCTLFYTYFRLWYTPTGKRSASHLKTIQDMTSWNFGSNESFVPEREWPSLQGGPSLVLWGILKLWFLSLYSHVTLLMRRGGPEGSAEQFQLEFLSLYTYVPSLTPTHAFFLSHQHCVRCNSYYENNVLIDVFLYVTCALSDIAPYQCVFSHIHWESVA